MGRNRRFSLVNTRGQGPTCPLGRLCFLKSMMALELQKRLFIIQYKADSTIVISLGKSSVSTSAEQIFSLRLSFTYLLLEGYALLTAVVEISNLFEKLKSNMIVPAYNIKNLLTAAAYFQLPSTSLYFVRSISDGTAFMFGPLCITTLIFCTLYSWKCCSYISYAIFMAI